MLAVWILLAAVFQGLYHGPEGELWRCRANLQRLGVALELYSLEHGGARMSPVYPEDLHRLVPEYLEALPTCPAAGYDTYARGYRRGRRGYTVTCRGRHHTRAGLGPDRPRYNWRTGLE